jgi:MFS family permease
MVGPVAGGILSANSLSFPFLISAFVSLINFIIIFIFLHETHHERDTKLLLKKGFINPKALVNALRGEFGILFFLLFAWSFYISNFNLTIPFFTLERFSYGAFENGIFFSFVGLIAGITQWFILPKIEKRIGDKKIILMGIIFLVIGQLIVPFSPIPLIFFSIFVFIIFGSALLRPSLSSQLSKKATEGQGTTMGLAFSFESLGRVIGPLLIGLSITNFGLAAPFFLTALVLTVGLILYHKYE